MTQSIFIKGLTLFSFVFLIGVFLIYRAGKFDTYLEINNSTLQTSHNGGAITSSKTDSLKSKKDSTQKLRLSSSKSVVITGERYFFTNPINKKPKTDSVKRLMLSSSKSAIIFKSFEKQKFKADSAKLDSIIKKLKKQ